MRGPPQNCAGCACVCLRAPACFGAWARACMHARNAPGASERPLCLPRRPKVSRALPARGPPRRRQQALLSLCNAEGSCDPVFSRELGQKSRRSPWARAISQLRLCSLEKTKCMGPGPGRALAPEGPWPRKGPGPGRAQAPGGALRCPVTSASPRTGQRNAQWVLIGGQGPQSKHAFDLWSKARAPTLCLLRIAQKQRDKWNTRGRSPRPPKSLCHPQSNQQTQSNAKNVPILTRKSKSQSEPEGL